METVTEMTPKADIALPQPCWSQLIKPGATDSDFDSVSDQYFLVYYIGMERARGWHASLELRTFGVCTVLTKTSLYTHGTATQSLMNTVISQEADGHTDNIPLGPPKISVGWYHGTIPRQRGTIFDGSTARTVLTQDNHNINAKYQRTWT